MNRFLRMMVYVLSIMQYVIWLFAGLLLVGFVGIFFGGQRSHGSFLFDYGDFIIKVPIIHPLLILSMAVVICFIMGSLLKIWGILLSNFSDGSYFNTMNSQYIKKSFLCLASLTIFQFLVSLVVNDLDLDNVSQVFDFSIRNYLVNLLLLMLNGALITVFKKGEEIQKDNEEII